jgi:hypothetical protein
LGYHSIDYEIKSFIDRGFSICIYRLEVDEMEVVLKMEGLTMKTETQESIALWLKEHSLFDT